eukprot:GGOE01056824.1.p1 GENE.GGOE01056824.1~~GGOE01056824.1.p1  ORF type:complete len:204 (+),score=49.16 GGOE01056824.1:54-614(+)
MAEALTDNGHGLGPAADGKAGLPKTPRQRTHHAATTTPQARGRRTTRPTSQPILLETAASLKAPAEPAPRRAMAVPKPEQWAEKVGSSMEGVVRRREELWTVMADALTDNGQHLGPAADGKTMIQHPLVTPKPDPTTSSRVHPTTYGDAFMEHPSGDFPLDPHHPLHSIHDALQLKLARRALYGAE